MKVLLGFPFRDNGDRQKIFDKVKPEVESLYDFHHVFVHDSGHEPFNRAATRNQIAAYADLCGYDVVVICDADSIPEKEPLARAIVSAEDDGRLHIPFTDVRVLSSRYAKPGNQAYKRVGSIYTYGPSCGGIFVIRPERWIYAGGMDERIIGWGYEDQIFLVAVHTFLQGPVFHNGYLYNFQHSRGSDPDYIVQNSALRDLYNENIGNRAKIREISVGSNDFCAYEGPSHEFM